MRKSPVYGLVLILNSGLQSLQGLLSFFLLILWPTNLSAFHRLSSLFFQSGNMLLRWMPIFMKKFESYCRGVFRLRNIMSLAVSILFVLLLSSCFTGVEGTKKIELSRAERKAVAPTAERLFSDSIEAEPLSRWKPGKEFLATDARLALLLSPHDGVSGIPADSLPGKVIRFLGVSTRRLPDGSEGSLLGFDIDGCRYDYSLSRPLGNADTTVRGDNLPMMIDLDLVGRMNKTLSGRTLWTRTQLWYKTDSLRIVGKKFIPVTIARVEPGNSVFPFKVVFSTDEGEDVFYFMNTGNSARDSRSFDTLFFLSDPRKRYTGIEQEVWDLICLGRVRNGMTKEECRLSMGPPADVIVGRDWSSTRDIWKYSDGRYLIFSDGLLTDFRL